MAAKLQSEVRELRARIATLMDEAATNEKLFKKNQARELDLLKAESLAELFAAICVGLKASYQLDALTLLLSDPEHEIRHLLLAERVSIEELPNVLFSESLLGMAPQFGSLRRPWLGPYVGSDHQLLFPGAHDLKSVALIPLWRQDKLHGSMNFGSNDAVRFTRHLGTDFLGHLGSIASFAVENAVNRARLVRSGLTDFLTGWHNRRYLHVRLREELARAQRQGTGLACLLIDLDHFKDINDRYGHHAGDLALREAAQRVDVQIRGSDTAARFGGDEFVVLIPDADLTHAGALAERIRVAVNATPLEISTQVRHPMTVSIGVARVLPSRTNQDLKALAEALLAAADAALYKAKQNGRDRVEIAV